MTTQAPTTEEVTQHAIRAYRGIELGLGAADPGAAVAAKLEAQYPGHLILIQAGTFLQGYDRTAHALSTLKSYKLKLVGTPIDPHIRCGFPVGNFRRRLWPMVAEFGIPYVVALGTKAADRTIYVSTEPTSKVNIFAAVTDQIVAQVVEDLRQRGDLNKAGARKLLESPDSTGFRLKSQAQELDTALLQDIIKMPRDIRTTYGENLRTCMARMMRTVMAFGLEDNKPAALRSISADVDLIKHYISQAPRLSHLKFAFENRAGLAVELGRLVGGLMKTVQVQS